MKKTYYFFAGCFLALSVLFSTGCETEKRTLSEEAACSGETDSSEKSVAEEEKRLGTQPKRSQIQRHIKMWKRKWNYSGLQMWSRCNMRWTGKWREQQKLASGN